MFALLIAAMMPTATQFKVARFIQLNPPVVFQRDEVTTCELNSVDAEMPWDEAIISWNVKPAAGTKLVVEARVLYSDKSTKWYALGDWSLDGTRKSIEGQKDEDGTVNTDTLSMKRHGGLLQLRLVGRTVNPQSKLSFLGVSFSDTTQGTVPDEPNKAAWGKSLDLPHRFQGDYPRGSGLCSPTSISMMLWHWSLSLQRPEFNEDVPAVEAGVWDPTYNGAGNWSFNVAYAGSFLGLRSYVTRLASLRELEDWIAAGLPVVCSVSYQLLKGQPLNRATEQGHLVVLVGFTGKGDPIFNDPASRETPKTYKRNDFIAAWEYSHRTVYFVYPDDANVPRSTVGRWLESK